MNYEELSFAARVGIDNFLFYVEKEDGFRFISNEDGHFLLENDCKAIVHAPDVCFTFIINAGASFSEAMKGTRFLFKSKKLSDLTAKLKAKRNF